VIASRHCERKRSNPAWAGKFWIAWSLRSSQSICSEVAAGALLCFVIAGQKARSAVFASKDPAIHAAVKSDIRTIDVRGASPWTTGSSSVVTNGGCGGLAPGQRDR